MVGIEELADIGQLPTDVEALQALLKQEECQLEELREEERKRRKQRMLQKKRPQAAPASDVSETIARVPTPLSPGRANPAAELRCQSPGGSVRTFQTLGEVEAEQARLEGELQTVLSSTRARLAEVVGRCGPFEELQQALSAVEELAQLETEWGCEELLLQLLEEARSLRNGLAERAESEAEAARLAAEAHAEAMAAAEAAAQATAEAAARATADAEELVKEAAKAKEAAEAAKLAKAEAAAGSPTIDKAASQTLNMVQDSPKRARIASGGPEMIHGSESDVESLTAEDRRMEAEIQELEAILRAHEASAHPSSSSSAPPPSGDDAGDGEPPKGKGKGKGFGKGKAGKGAPGAAPPAAPPPKSGGPASKAAAAPAGSRTAPGKAGAPKGQPPSAVGSGQGDGSARKHAPPPKAPGAARTSKCVNLHWKTSSAVEDASAVGVGFFERLEAAFVAAGGDPGGSTGAAPAPEVHFPARPETVFDPQVEVEEVPREVLEHYFTKSSLRTGWNVQVRSERAEQASLEEWKRSRLDDRVVKMLEIVMKRYTMEHKTAGEREATMAIKKAILLCDFDVVRLEGLSVIRSAMRQHEKDGMKVLEFVRLRGEDALDEVEFPELHRFIYELCKIPQIDERLECMLFHVTFLESLTGCQQQLTTLRQVLQMLNSKRETIQRFFVTAHKLGQSLNRGSNAHQAPNGFQLCTLEKLSQTRSTKFPKLSILHFVLALVSRRDARELFDAEDLALLQSAKALRTHKVYQDCVELAQGIYGVQQIVETGNYTCPATGEAIKIERRRKSMPPQPSAQAACAYGAQMEEDSDDRFHEVLKEFVADSLEVAEDIAEGAFEVILTYKELALYFDDLPSVYPPPKNERDTRKDLVEIFSKFAEEIRKHRDEVESEGLRELIGNSTSSEVSTPEPSSRASLPASALQGSSSVVESRSSSGGLLLDGSPLRKPRFTQEASALRVSPKPGSEGAPRRPRFTTEPEEQPLKLSPGVDGVRRKPSFSFTIDEDEPLKLSLAEDEPLKLSPLGGDGGRRAPRFTVDGGSPGRPPLPVVEQSPCRAPLPRPMPSRLAASSSPGRGGDLASGSSCLTPGAEGSPGGVASAAGAPSPSGGSRKFELNVTPKSSPVSRNGFVDRELEYFEHNERST